MPGIFSLPNSPVDSLVDQAEHRGHDGGEQAERNCSEQVPILELVLRHLVGVQEDRAGDGEVESERDARRDDRADQGPGEPGPAGTGDLHDHHHHDDGAGEQAAVGAAEAGQCGGLGILGVESAPARDPGAEPAADRAERLFRAQACTADERDGRDGHDGWDRARLDAFVLQVSNQARRLVGQVGQPAEETDEETGGGGDHDPPPLAAEPARVWIGVPVVADADHSHEQQSRDGTERAERDRVEHQCPQRPGLGRRWRRLRFPSGAHPAARPLLRFTTDAA